MKHSKITSIVLAVCMLVTLMVVPVSAAEPAITNGDFESGELSPWKPTSTGGNPTVEVDAETGNHYLLLDTQQKECVRQTVYGLTEGKHYYIAFDIKTNGACGHMNIYPVKNTAFTAMNSYDTGGKWERHAAEWVADDVSVRIEFRLQTASGTVTNEQAMIDNVVIVEVENNLLQNAGFEHGINGMGTDGGATQGNWIGYWKQSNSTGYEATYTQVDGGMGGTKALKVVRANADNAQDKWSQIAQDRVNVTEGEKYVFTVYVKAGEDYVPQVASAQFYIAANNAVKKDGTSGTVSDSPTKKLTAANGWTSFSLVFTAASTTQATVSFRTLGSGTIYYDNFSVRKLDASTPAVEYVKADGDVSENLVDGGKATITMPVAAGDVDNAVALAVYSEAEGTKTLKSLKVKMITAEEVTAGHARFTLTAGTLGDFADANYTAKIMTMKNGLLVPLHDVVLYTEAQ